MELVAPWEAVSRFQPDFPPLAARVFLCVMVPVWLYMAWYDMARLKILNGLVLFTFGVFVVIGPFVLPLSMYFGQILQAFAVLALMLLLYTTGAMGGGDAKFIAAASPYFMRTDLPLIIIIFASCCLGAFVAHRGFLIFGTDRALPLWQSWRSGRRFPLGFALGGIVSIYLVLAAT